MRIPNKEHKAMLTKVVNDLITKLSDQIDMESKINDVDPLIFSILLWDALSVNLLTNKIKPDKMVDNLKDLIQRFKESDVDPDQGLLFEVT